MEFPPCQSSPRRSSALACEAFSSSKCRLQATEASATHNCIIRPRRRPSPNHGNGECRACCRKAGRELLRGMRPPWPAAFWGLSRKTGSALPRRDCKRRAGWIRLSPRAAFRPKFFDAERTSPAQPPPHWRRNAPQLRGRLGGRMSRVCS